MAVFLVVAINDVSGAAVLAALMANFPNEHYSITHRAWFVNSDSPTAMGLSDSLGITKAGGQTPIMGVVVSIKGYYGTAPGDLWEWVSSKVEKANG